MCGIAGVLDVSASQSSEHLDASARRMIGALVHRGPDGSGVWVDREAGVALGHRRLAILDLSPAGAQPMASACGRYVVTFNGEIYNHRAIRRELERIAAAERWRGHSDTEVMLAAIAHWGVRKALGAFNGMFAFALWDKGDRRLYLARDRLGEKPLYFGWVGDAFLFGSELKALRAHPSWHGEVDRDALALFMRHNYVPAPYSIYKGIQKLQPGALLSFSLERAAKQRSYEIEQYWSAKAAAETGAAAMFDGSSADAIAALDERLREAVGLRMEADVPLGAFLSGGIDSSTVVALMQAQSARPVRTFSIGFLEDSYNEAQYAKAVARHLGTEHTELYVTPEETMAAIPKMPTLYDEPFADSSQIPTFLVSKLARQHVVVTLSGDGGDELFAGYNRYFWGRGLWRKVGWMPKSVRRGIGRALVRRPPQNWDRLFDTLGRFVPRALRQPNPGDKLHKLAEVLGVESPDEMYHWLVSHWKHPAELVKGGDEPPTALTDKSQWANLTDFIQRMMFLDQVSYLPDDVLAKVDRASMGVSLESRVPLLDHHLVEFAWHLPVSMKIRHGQGKWLLRQVLYRHVPKELVERPKMGFGVPIDHWLRGPLRDWAESLLDERRLEREGFFRPQPIREKWHEHLSGRRNWQYYLWDVLMFQAWFERWEQRAG